MGGRGVNKIMSLELVPLGRMLLKVIIEASLSEPHTSGTALWKCVCMLVCLRPHTVNFK